MTKLERLQEIERQAEELRKEIELESGIDWMPKVGEGYWFINDYEHVDCERNDGHYADTARFRAFNYFQTREQAEKASKLRIRSNAIIRACILIDPDYEPDWSDKEARKFTVYYCNFQTKWRVTDSRTANIFVAYVSTYEKAQQVCELLTKWGVK
jgi:hypothetical protein